MKKEKKQKIQKVRTPISLKLVTIFSILAIFILALAATLVSTLVRNDERIKAEENNHTINNITGEAIQTSFLNYQTSTNTYLNTLLVYSDNKNDESDNEAKKTVLFEDFCIQNPETVFIYTSEDGIKANESFLKAHSDLKLKFEEWLKVNPASINAVKNGEFIIKNFSSLFNTPLVCILYPHLNTVSQKTDLVAVAFTVNNLSDLLSSKSYETSFLINKDGEILIHSDDDKTIRGENISYLEAITQMKNSSAKNSQFLLPDENGEMYFYSYSRIVGDMCVITCVSEALVYETINQTTYRIIIASFAILFLSIIIIRFFSKTLTNPIESLVEATKSIGVGNYELELKPKTRDEIGFLTSNFIEMAYGLAERERLMNTFTKFTNKYIAEKASKGELKPGGERKNATIFFSDIRSFTALSEKLSPDEVVEFLNEYFARMCECVDKTSGIVDKFIGDAVMAVWGAPESSGSPQTDAWNAVKAALMMRIALYHLNQKREKSGKIKIKIGCGINSGPIVAGQIGSDGHMNYTVIGDTVNLASRTEALNKPFATDILITENTYVLIKDKIIVEEMPGVHVKGKTDPIKMYAVVNAIGVKGPGDIHELRKFLEWDEPDLGKVSTDEEEKKYKIDG